MGGRNGGVAWWVGVVGGRGRGWVGEHMDERVLTRQGSGNIHTYLLKYLYNLPFFTMIIIKY